MYGWVTSVTQGAVSVVDTRDSQVERGFGSPITSR